MASPLDRMDAKAATTSASATADPRATHRFRKQMSTLPEGLQLLLRPDWKDNKEVTCLKLYSMLFHFGLQGKLKPGSRKHLLVAAFEDDLRPLILDFCVTETHEESMDEDDVDFDPLSTTNNTLKAFIKKRAPPRFKFSPAATRDALLVLYKKFVSSDLVLPKSDKYTKSPRLLTKNAISKLTIEDLQFGLHCHAPHVFIHHALMHRDDYVSLYLYFLLDDETAAEKVIEGYHYSIVSDRVEKPKD